MLWVDLKTSPYFCMAKNITQIMPQLLSELSHPDCNPWLHLLLGFEALLVNMGMAGK